MIIIISWLAFSFSAGWIWAIFREGQKRRKGDCPCVVCDYEVRKGREGWDD